MLLTICHEFSNFPSEEPTQCSGVNQSGLTVLLHTPRTEYVKFNARSKKKKFFFPVFEIIKALKTNIFVNNNTHIR